MLLLASLHPLQRRANSPQTLFNAGFPTPGPDLLNGPAMVAVICACPRYALTVQITCNSDTIVHKGDTECRIKIVASPFRPFSPWAAWASSPLRSRRLGRLPG